MRQFHFDLHFDRKKQLTAIDKSMAVAAVVQPLMTLPQVIQIFTTQNVTGISLLTWVAYLVLGLVFLAYGIAHSIKPLIVTQILWFTVDLLVVVGIIIYR
ncbi:hypothetical protein CYG49_04885 [Candidatus Saccharibacteria bacterium]|nr:MAG: hypothetical protein CYG49_04885 [Candidatus Saccharibacteria bacterium]